MAAKPIRDNRLLSRLVRATALLCVRNTALGGFLAGRGPVTRTDDYSDATVVDAEGNRIPRPEVSHFDDNAMCALMHGVVDKLWTFMVSSREPGCR